MTDKTVSVPQQGNCTHPQTTYMIGNTYCTVCRDWLHAGFHKPASEPISVPTESRPTTLDTFLGYELSGRSLPELLNLAAQMLTDRGDGPVADCLRDKAYQAEAAIADAASSSLLPVGRPAFYVASRASIPARSEMWRDLRSRGMNIVSSWIDEAGDGETGSFEELWQRIYREIQSSTALILYAEHGDFPLKGALIEVGIALGMGKPVMLSLPGVVLEGRTYKPLGSWIEHPGVTRLSTSLEAFCYKTPAPSPLASLPVGESTRSMRELAEKHGFPPVSEEQQERNAADEGIEPVRGHGESREPLPPK